MAEYRRPFAEPGEGRRPTRPNQKRQLHTFGTHDGSPLAWKRPVRIYWTKNSSSRSESCASTARRLSSRKRAVASLCRTALFHVLTSKGFAAPRVFFSHVPNVMKSLHFH